MTGDTFELVEPSAEVEHKRGARTVGNHYKLASMRGWKGPFHVLVPSVGSAKRRTHWDLVEEVAEEPEEGWPRYLAREHGEGTYWVQGFSKGQAVRVRVQVTPRMAQAYAVTIEAPRRANPAGEVVTPMLAMMQEANRELRAELAELRAALMERDTPAADDDLAERLAEVLAERQPNPAPTLWTPDGIARIVAAVGPMLAKMAPPPAAPSPWAPVIALFERSGQTPASVLDSIQRAAEVAASEGEGEA